MWRNKPEEAYELQKAAEGSHQGWPTPVEGSPPGSLNVYNVHIGRDKEFISVCRLIGLCTTGKEPARHWIYWYLQQTCKPYIELKVVAKLKSGEMRNKKGGKAS